MNKLLRSMDISQVFKVKQLRLIALLLTVMVLGACTSRAAMEAEQAAAEQARIAEEQEVARVAAEQARQRAAAEERERQVRIQEQQRVEAERRRQAEIARREAEARAEQEQQAREQARRRELQQRREAQALAQAEQEREQKLARIAELEDQIAQMQADVSTADEVNALYQEAILVAEELVNVLASEQSKYDNVDNEGNLLEPLSKDLVAELEDRKDSLVQEAEAAAAQ